MNALALRTELTEPELIDRARGGDADAFELLYRIHHARALGLSLRLVCDRQLAEDVVQDAFVRAWAALPAFRGASNFGTWLHTIVTRSAAQHLRVRSRDVLRFDSSSALEFYADPVTGKPDSKLDLERAIAKLPDGARMVLVLHDIEGYRYEEIGVALDIALGTVKSQLHRARKLVLAALEK